MPCTCTPDGLAGYGYKPQAGSYGLAPRTWRLPYRLTRPTLGNLPLGLLPHQDEQRALEMVRRKLHAGTTTDAARDPHITGMARALQSRIASVSASQNGTLTANQFRQVNAMNRAINRRAGARGLGAYVALDFPLPAPLDDGTTVADVAGANFPLMTNGIIPGATPAPPPAATGPSFATLAVIGLAAWYFFFRK